ncbi:Alpha/Beta hydrolase protein [Haematococcus lacustris]
MSNLAQLVAHHELGGRADAPALLFLHPNSLCGRVFQPMVQQLGQHFRCIALDAPGHGCSPAWPGELPSSYAPLLDCVQAKIEELGLLGCCVFGQSMGGSIALSLEQRQPGTFKALYLFEPVAATASSMAAREEEEEEEEGQGARATGGSRIGSAAASVAMCKILVDGARRRRTHWASAEQAAAQLRSKPPYSAWHADCFTAYLECGLNPVLSQLSQPPQLTPSNSVTTQAAATESKFTNSKDGSGKGQGGVELSCSRAMEEVGYLLNQPPVKVLPHRLLCPMAWAVGRTLPGVPGILPRLAACSVLEVPKAQLRRFPTLSHFGAQEDPQGVAADVLAFFFALPCSGTVSRL